MEKQKSFYGWRVLAALVFIMAIGMGLYGGVNSAFVKPVCDNLGVPRGELTLYRTIISLVGAALMPFYGRLIRKVGVRKLLIASSFGIPLAYFCYSWASQLWHFYLIAFLEGLFTNGISFLTVGTVVNNWFESKRAVATGLAFAGSGLGGAAFMPVVSAVIEAWGWRWAYRMTAAAGLALLLPAVLLVVRDAPGQMGLAPYRSGQEGERKVALPAQGLSRKGAGKTAPFWLLAAGFFLISVCCGGPYTHTTAYFSDIGYTSAYAASVTSVYMVFLTIGKVLLGGIFDRFGALRATVLIGLCCIAFPVLALLGRIPLMPFCYAAVLGIADAGCSVAITVLVSRVFGDADFSSIFGVMSMVSTFGIAASGPLMGMIYDISGGYAAAWVMLLILGALTAVCLVGAVVLMHRREKRAEPCN